MSKKINFVHCDEKYIDKLIDFIDINWKSAHIFTKSKKLLDWQHRHGEDNYNFVLAVNTENDTIVGVLGYIPVSQYASSLSQHSEAWLAIWKVREDIQEPGVGILLLQFLKKSHKFKTICAIGLSQMVIPIYKAFGYKVGVLNHSVLINNKINKFSILKTNKPIKPIFIVPSTHSYTLLELQQHDLLSISNEVSNKIFITHPKKNPEYILNRYVNHPHYAYQVFAVISDNELQAMLVTRSIHIKDSKVLRIVDYQGCFTHLQYINQPLQQLLQQNNYEYVDFMQHGVPIDLLTKSGFIHLTKDNDDLIVPNYFEPFEQRNITLDYAYHTKDSENQFLICKGDSDQDRPNMV